MNKIACVIVTYNRKDDLLICLRAVLGQSELPSSVYIVDNASTDGTGEMLAEMGYMGNGDTMPADPELHYLRMNENIGGAGGFYEGMKAAYNAGAEAIWVMDDDGVPEATCLEAMRPHLSNYDYIAPMVIDVKDHSRLAFEYCGEKQEFMQRAVDGLVQGVACPFNGILYSRRLVETIGFPKKEMFIWGDEENYNMRALKAGFRPVTVVAAVHRHPANRVMTAPSLLGPIDISQQMWRSYCRYRNAMYNHRDEMTLLGKTYVFINHVWYYLFVKHSLGWTFCYINAFIDGLRGDFTRLNRYKK